MKKLICLAAASLIIASTVGCANGPIRNWMRGAACNTCQPQLQPSYDTQAVGTCTDGCATGSAIPNPIIQPGAEFSGAAPQPTSGYYYSGNDPTTQNYETQPAYGALPYGQIQGQGQFQQPNQAFGTGTVGNAITPPTIQPMSGPITSPMTGPSGY